jgi:hypothetical protein
VSRTGSQTGRQELSRIRSLSNGAKLNVAGLVLTAIGMLFEIGAGSELYPTLTGPIVLLIGAAAVAFRPGRWTGYLGLIIPFVLGLGLIVSVALSPAFVDQLTDTDNAGIVAGSLLHVVGLVTGIVGGFGMVLRGPWQPDPGV